MNAPVEWRALGLPAFFALCLVLSFACDVAFATLADHGWLARLPALPFWLPFVIVPALLCAAAGAFFGQWRMSRSGVALAAAAAWCAVSPLVVLVPFVSFMCYAFNSCFGD